MKSRTSFFNPTILRKDITRFFPIWGLYLIGGSLTLLTSLAALANSDSLVMGVASNLQFMGAANMIFALLSALLLFGDLFKPRHCNMLHAMPIRRETWFNTHFVAGLLFSFVPNLLLALPITLFCGRHWYVGIIWLVTCDLQYLFFFCTAVFAVMCAGKKFAATAIYLLLHFAAFIIYWFLSVYYVPLMSGIVLEIDRFIPFCPVVQLIAAPFIDYKRNYYPINPNYPYSEKYSVFTVNGLAPNFYYLLIVAAVGFGFAVLALVMYRRRRLETAGDFMSARPLAPVFSLIYTLSVGALFHMLFGGIALFLPIGLAVGYFTSQMLLQRKVNVFQRRRMGIFGLIVLVALLSLGATWLDPLGVTRYVPKASQVKAVAISDSYGINYNFDSSLPGGEIIGGPVSNDTERVETITTLHKAIVKETATPLKKLLIPFISDDTATVSVVYKLKGGYQLHRRYEVPLNSDAGKQVTTFFSSPEYVFGCEDWDTYLPSVTRVVVGDYAFYGQQAEELLLAMKTDCELGRMSRYAGGNYEGFIEIRRGDAWQDVTVYSTCKYTVSWLNKHCPGWDY